MLFEIVVRIFMVFQRLLCTEYESRFMAPSSNQQVAINICTDLFKDDHSVCCNGHESAILYKICATKMTNILLNNYTVRSSVMPLS
jgi:hypothetical protein